MVPACAVCVGSDEAKGRETEVPIPVFAPVAVKPSKRRARQCLLPSSYNCCFLAPG